MSERVSLGAPIQPPQAEPDDAVPAELIPLPSKGLVYPEGHPFHNVQAVEVMAMTAKEEDILTSPALIKQGKAMDALMRSCLVRKDVSTPDLLSADRNAILAGIRANGYGTEYNTDVVCPECGETVEYSFDISKWPIKPLEAQPVVPGENVFSFVLPSKRTVTFRLPTGATERDSDAEEEMRVKKLGGGASAAVTTKLFYHVIDINGERDTKKLRRLIEKMPARDSRALRKHMIDIAPALQTVSSFTCTACGKTTEEVEVPLGTEFFWPSR